MTSVALLAIGSEILDGRVQDTNSNYLCRVLNESGYQVSATMSCTDDLKQISDALGFLCHSNSAIIITGGLGPTTDDLTRDAVAQFCNKELVRSEKAAAAIKDIYEKRGRKLDDTNDSQTFLPKDSLIIDNPVGTAPGFFIRHAESKTLLISLPGVPVEMKAIFHESVMSVLQKELPAAIPLNVSGFKCFGLPEATIGAKIRELSLPEGITVSYRASFPEVHVALKSQSIDLRQYTSQAKEAVGINYVFSDSLGESYEKVVQELLLQSKMTVSAAESCSGGLLASLLTNTPGASAVYKGTIVSYANAVKESVLGVPAELLAAHGAVSSEVACAMASKCRAVMETDLAVSITGIAGPDGGSDSKPVGLFYAALAHKDGVFFRRGFIPVDRKRIRIYAAHFGLDMLRRHLLNLSPINDASLPAV